MKRREPVSFERSSIHCYLCIGTIAVMAISLRATYDRPKVDRIGLDRNFSYTIIVRSSNASVGCVRRTISMRILSQRFVELFKVTERRYHGVRFRLSVNPESRGVLVSEIPWNLLLYVCE